MKSKMNVFSLFVVFSFFNIGSAQIVEDFIKSLEKQPVEIVDTLGRIYDTRGLTVRKIDQNLKEQYSGGEFNYERTQNSSQNLFGRFLSWALEGIQNIFGFTLSPLTLRLLSYLFYFLIGAVVVFMIVKLIGNENASKLFGRTAIKPSSVVLEESHIEEMDFSYLIQNNEQEGNYRSAVRYQYLALLKSLSAKKLIDWDFQKTNTDYYRELKHIATKKHFKKISYLYDHVWYGEFDIDHNLYRDAVTEFDNLKNRAL
jgi:hypothetical protein